MPEQTPSSLLRLSLWQMLLGQSAMIKQMQGQEADLHHGVVASCQKRAGGITQAHTNIHALGRHIGQSDVHSIQEPGEACADQLQRHTSRQSSSGLNQQNSLQGWQACQDVTLYLCNICPLARAFIYSEVILHDVR